MGGFSFFKYVYVVAALDNYLSSLPLDPGGTTGEDTEYAIRVNTTTGIVTVASCSDEGSQIEVSR